MTLPAQKLEVVEVQSHLRPMDVHRRQLLDVMHDHARPVYSFTHTVLTQVMHTLCVFVPAVLPGFRTVEAPREFSGHDIYAIQKDGGESVPLWF